MFRQNVRRIRLQHAVVPLLFTTCVLPADRRRDRVSPIFRSTIKTLSGYTSLFIPTVPIPDTSKIKDRILGNLPSWATKSASSTFVKKPQADLVVALSLESKVFRVFVAYYPKGQEIIVQSGGDEEAGEDWIEIVKPEIENVDGWRYVSEVGDTSWCPSVIQYTTSQPHRATDVGHDYYNGYSPRYAPENREFQIHFEDFILSNPEMVENRGNKPLTFDVTSQQAMTDFARIIREHTERYIARNVLNKAIIVNEVPIVKWMVMYPDVLDSLGPTGATSKRDFMIAFKEAGYPMEERDIPAPKLEEDDGSPVGFSTLESLLTEDRMTEFMSAGFAGLVGYTAFQPINTHIPAVPQENPFVTMYDDQLFLTTRLCVLTPEARFGVLHHPYCSASPSPIHKLLTDEHVTTVITKFAREGLIPWTPGIDIDISEDQKMIDLVTSYVIVDWPDASCWKEVVKFLEPGYDTQNGRVEIVTDANIHTALGVGGSKTYDLSSLVFAMLVHRGLGIPTVQTFGAVHMNEPTMTDVILFDPCNGEGDAYKAALNWINIPKDFSKPSPLTFTTPDGSNATLVKVEPEPRSDTSSAEPSQPATPSVESSPSPSDLSSISTSNPDQETATIDPPPPPPPQVNVLIEAPELALLARADTLWEAGLTEEDIKDAKESRVGWNKDDFRKLRVIRPQEDGVYMETGIVEAARLELARIFGDSLRK